MKNYWENVETGINQLITFLKKILELVKYSLTCLLKLLSKIHLMESHFINGKLIQIIYGQKPDRRSIHWFYDKIGCKGKHLAIHLCLKYPNQVLYVTGKASDVKYGVSH